MAKKGRRKTSSHGSDIGSCDGKSNAHAVPHGKPLTSGRNNNSSRISPGDGGSQGGDPKAPGTDGRRGGNKSGGFRAMTCVALKAHHGRHLRVEQCGEVKASSTIIADPEQFSITFNDDKTVSFQAHCGRYLSVGRGALVVAEEPDAGSKIPRFEFECHENGLISLHCSAGYVAAEGKCTIRANRSKVGAWEKFLPKDRSRQKAQNDIGAGVKKGKSNRESLSTPLFFDACCQLQGVLSAEEDYAATHTDKVATTFSKRSRQRRALGVEFSFRHFRKDQGYPSSFRGCTSFWDATLMLMSGEDAPATEPLHHGGLPCAARAWSTVLGELDGQDAGVPKRHGDRGSSFVHAAFGIPPHSAAEANSAAMERLRQLSRLPECVAIGPVGLCSPPQTPVLAVDGVHAVAPADISLGRQCPDRHRGLGRADLGAEFGARPGAKYQATKDPACLSWVAAGGADADSWILRHGDRRMREFSAACADYEARRASAEVRVVEEQISIAKEVGLPLIVRLPPNDEVERRMAEILSARLGGNGCTHPILLSGFHGRAKCALALLKHFPCLMIGFSGLLTHAKVKEQLGEVAFDVPSDRFVLESLGPQYPPSSVGGGRGAYSHPLHVRNAAAALATVRGATEKAVMEAAYNNVLQLFSLQHTPPCAEEDNAPAGNIVTSEVPVPSGGVVIGSCSMADHQPAEGTVTGCGSGDERDVGTKAGDVIRSGTESAENSDDEQRQEPPSR